VQCSIGWELPSRRLGCCFCQTTKKIKESWRLDMSCKIIPAVVAAILLGGTLAASAQASSAEGAGGRGGAYAGYSGHRGAPYGYRDERGYYDYAPGPGPSYYDYAPGPGYYDYAPGPYLFGRGLDVELGAPGW
jgi:hypothetical protein